jgi:hypothetical protein
MDGAFVSFASILSLLFDHYNVPGEPPVYGSVVVAAYGGLTTVFGVLSSLIIAIVLQKT